MDLMFENSVNSNICFTSNLSESLVGRIFDKFGVVVLLFLCPWCLRRHRYSGLSLGIMTGVDPWH